MIENADLGAKLSKSQFKAREAPLEERFMTMQRRLLDLKVPVAVLVEGWDAAGKGDVINFLMNRLDPRGARVRPFFEPTEEERLRPELWRYWGALPGRGSIVLFDRSWYHQALVDRVQRGMKRRAWEARLACLRDFEATLAVDGMVWVKLFLHISRKEQRRRFEDIEADKDTAWRVTGTEWKRHELYDEYLGAADEMLRRTHAPGAAWMVVPATDRRYRLWSCADAVLRRLEEAARRAERKRVAKVRKAAAAGRDAENPLDAMNLGLKSSEESYRRELRPLERRLRELQFRCHRKRRGVIVAFEGADAAGKGGAIRRLTAALDPRGYTVIPVGAPQGEEAAHHYLWRFWKEAPKAGHWTVFDRTWYGRVLVERVEGFAGEDEWRRAYAEIREFETQLFDAGIILVKFWLQIDKGEQLRRFKARESHQAKKWKITDEDWRNREKWDAYREAAGDMIRMTSATAQWTLVEANDKRWARLKVLRTVADAVEEAL